MPPSRPLARGFTPAEKRKRLIDRSLVGLAEVAECGERDFDVFVIGQSERIESAAGEIEKVVAAHFADRAQLALPAVTPAQQLPDAVAAAVVEALEMNR